MFRLRKWYFDVVTSDGIAFIGYAARLKWGPLSARYRATLLCRPGLPPEETHTLRRSPDPERLPDGSVSWTCKPLGLNGHWMPTFDPIRRRLFQSPAGTADWEFLAPAAEVVLRLGEMTLEGWGYAEQLVLTTPPWKLNMGDLLWGRFVGADTSVVWVHWKGSGAPPLVMANGVEQPGATLTENEIHIPDIQVHLELGPRRVLREGPVLDVLTAVPLLARRLPSGLSGVIERKWLSPGHLTFRGADPVTGWAIHEAVEWHSPGLE